MSSDLSPYLGNKLARWMAGNAMPSAPTTVYCALFNGNPKAGGTEITTGIRPAGRVAIVWAALPAGTGMLLSSDAAVDFGNNDGADTTLTHLAVYDAASGGNLLASKAVSGGSVPVAAGAEVKFEAGDLTFQAGSAT